MISTVASPLPCRIEAAAQLQGVIKSSPLRLRNGSGTRTQQAPFPPMDATKSGQTGLEVGHASSKTFEKPNCTEDDDFMHVRKPTSEVEENLSYTMDPSKHQNIRSSFPTNEVEEEWQHLRMPPRMNSNRSLVSSDILDAP